MAPQGYALRMAIINALVLMSCTTPTLASEPNWPQFRGPGGLGVASDEKTYPSILDPSRNLLWKAEIPEGYSSPCIWGDRIFITAANGKSMETICLDRHDGHVRWRKSVQVDELERISGSNNHASPTPVCDGTNVYIHFGSFGLIAYDLKGHEAWRHPLPTPAMLHGTGASPILAGGLVIINCDQREAPYLLAVDKITGQQVWKTARPVAKYALNWSTPVLWRHGTQAELVVLGCERLIAYDPSNGQKRWWIEGLPYETASTPTYSDESLFAAATVGGTGDPVNPIELPTFDELIESYDSDGDNRLVQAEIPEELTDIYRVGFEYTGIKQRFSKIDTDADGVITRPEWEKIVMDTQKRPPLRDGYALCGS